MIFMIEKYWSPIKALCKIALFWPKVSSCDSSTNNNNNNNNNNRVAF
jgi:hypothetical protein